MGDPDLNGRNGGGKGANNKIDLLWKVLTLAAELRRRFVVLKLESFTPGSYLYHPFG
jgi:hypothetical protein